MVFEDKYVVMSVVWKAYGIITPPVIDTKIDEEKQKLNFNSKQTRLECVYHLAVQLTVHISMTQSTLTVKCCS